MASTGPGPAPVSVGDDDRSRLEALGADEAASDRMRARARIVLAAAEGVPNNEIAERTGVHPATVKLWRDRWAAEGMAGLEHRTPTPARGKRIGRPQAPLVLDDEAREVLARGGGAWWSTVPDEGGETLDRRLVVTVSIVDVQHGDLHDWHAFLLLHSRNEQSRTSHEMNDGLRVVPPTTSAGGP